MIPALTSPHVFACHCDVQPDRIVAGLLVTHEDCELGTHTLYNPENEGECYAVNLAELPDRPYQVVLNRVSIPDANQ